MDIPKIPYALFWQLSRSIWHMPRHTQILEENDLSKYWYCFLVNENNWFLEVLILNPGKAWECKPVIKIFLHLLLCFNSGKFRLLFIICYWWWKMFVKNAAVEISKKPNIKMWKSKYLMGSFFFSDQLFWALWLINKSQQ